MIVAPFALHKTLGDAEGLRTVVYIAVNKEKKSCIL